MRGFARLGVLLLASVLAPSVAAQSGSDRKPPNVLFVCVDDLRPQLRAAGEGFMDTPHLDQLAATGRLFLRHYVQVPTCGASRYSLWTGRYPDLPVAHDNGAFQLMQDRPRQPASLAAHFRQQGYRTVSIGKVSHTPDGRRVNQAGQGDGEPEMPGSWDEVGAPAGQWGRSWDAFFGYASGDGRTRGQSPPIESADVDDHGYPDAHLADAAISALARLKGQPFFLAVGFYKPHLPFNAPKRDWDRYDATALPLSGAPSFPIGTERRISGHGGGELFGNYGSHPADRLGEAYARQLRHGYFAAVSYVDRQIGRVLQELEDQGLADDTIVVVWGDHGWHLGDLAIWGKHTLFEWSLRSTLIVRVPGQSEPGIATRAIVESVDLYPTLAELCGLPIPAELDGVSIADVIRDPRAEARGRALGFWRKGGLRGRTVRTPAYRLVEWKRGSETEQIELYDHRVDPGETRNVAQRHPDVVSRLLREL